MIFVGLDLTSAFSKRPRPIDIAILEADLRLPIRFGLASWPHAQRVIDRDGDAIEKSIRESVARAGASAGHEQVWAIDGPQALSRNGAGARRCEVLLCTPGRTPSVLPEVGSTAPFQSYVRSSLDLFGALRGRPLELLEVFPGAEWRALAGGPLVKKTSSAGRTERRALLEHLGIRGLPVCPTADQNDAAIAAYIAWCTRHAPAWLDWVGEPLVDDGSQHREGKIAHLSRSLVERPVRATRSGVVKVESIQKEFGDEEADWSGESGLAIRFTDDGLVHGKTPENRWLEPGQRYVLECQSVDGKPVRFELVHSSGFSGGLGWKCLPSIRKVLCALGTPVARLAGDQAVTVEVKLLDRGGQ